MIVTQEHFRSAAAENAAMRPTLYCVVPVYNEAANLDRLLGGLEQFSGEIGVMADQRLVLVLVDDGSTDGTRRIAENSRTSLAIQVLRHERNRGPGAAFATAFEYLSGVLQSDDLVLTLEGDSTSRLDTARRMLVRLSEGYDAVLASPYAYGGGFMNTSLTRLVLSHGANGFLKGVLGLRGIHTMSSFFRLYRANLLRKLQGTFGPRIVEANGFEGIVELLIKMVLVGATISEVEMKLDSSQRIGRSKMKILRTIRGYLGLAVSRRRWMKQAGASLWNYACPASLPCLIEEDTRVSA